MQNLYFLPRQKSFWIKLPKYALLGMKICSHCKLVEDSILLIYYPFPFLYLLMDSWYDINIISPKWQSTFKPMLLLFICSSCFVIYISYYQKRSIVNLISIFFFLFFLFFSIKGEIQPNMYLIVIQLSSCPVRSAIVV